MKLLLALILVVPFSWVRAQEPTYTFVFLHKKTDAAPIPREQLDSLMKGHLANIGRLADAGKLVAAGPFEGGGGMFILNTTSTAEAREWLSTDPGIRANRWDIEILAYHPRTGAVCKVHEPYEMVTYHFIRFKPVKERGADSAVAGVIAAHDQYLNKLKETVPVITEAFFDDEGGGIVVFPGAEGIIISGPAVKAGLLTVERKELWIAKGSFCEK